MPSKKRKVSVTGEMSIARFLFEIGTMRKLPRMHRQTLLTDDMSDTIASHSYRVAMIGWFLAKEEGADPYKVVMMCLLHDVGEARTGDHNWIHKRYVKIFDREILEEQLGSLPYPELFEMALEYDARESKEAKLAKEADLLDQLLLLREYEWQGNREAELWLYGNKRQRTPKGVALKRPQLEQLKKLKTKTAKRLGKAMYQENPSSWWSGLWTSKNR